MLSLTAHAIVLFLGACLATIYFVPKIISIVKFKHLMDRPNERSSHVQATPSLGGVAFYLVFIFSMYCNFKFDVHQVTMSIIPGLTILLFLGLKDDLVVLAPRTKMVGQFVACVFVLWNAQFNSVNLHGFFGLYDIHPVAGTLIALVMMLTIINAFNLIDGIDGLAASIGIISFTSFSILFMMMHCYFLAMSALAMCGILSGFLVFNLSRKPNMRIFMGDTGSMLIGFLIAVMCERFLSLDTKNLNHLPFQAIYIPLIIVSIVMIPFYDTVRVFTIRMLAGKSPFTADRNHMHHVLLDSLRFSHRRTSFIIAVFAGFNVLTTLLLVRFTTLWITIGVFAVGATLLTYVLYRLKQRIPVKSVTRKKIKSKVNRRKLKNDRQINIVKHYSETP